MGDVKFNPEDDFNPESLENEETGLELSPQTTGALAVPGEARFTATLRPIYLSIAHGVGGLAQEGFTPGQLVLDKEVVVYSPPTKGKEGGDPAIVTILSAVEFWKEVTQFGSPDLPRTWATKQEAIADGMTTEYPPWGSGDPLPTCRPALNLKLLVKEPEDVEDRGRFLIEANGAFWAPCSMIADKGQYNEVIDPLTRASFTHKATGLYSATWALSTRNKMVKSTGNYVWVPAIRTIGTKTEAEVKELLAAIGQ